MKKYLKYLAIAGGLALFAIGLPELALAQDAVTTVTTTTPPLTDTQVNISNVKESIIVFGGTVLTAILGWIGLAVRAMIAKKYDLDKTTLDEKLQAIFDVAAKRGIAFAETTLKQKVPDTIDAKNEFVKMAADYVIGHWPDIVSFTGMSEKNVRDAIISRLPSPTAKEADQLALVKAGAAAPVSVAISPSPAKS